MAAPPPPESLFPHTGCIFKIHRNSRTPALHPRGLEIQDNEGGVCLVHPGDISSASRFRGNFLSYTLHIVSSSVLSLYEIIFILAHVFLLSNKSRLDDMSWLGAETVVSVFRSLDVSLC